MYIGFIDHKSALRLTLERPIATEARPYDTHLISVRRLPSDLIKVKIIKKTTKRSEVFVRTRVDAMSTRSTTCGRGSSNGNGNENGPVGRRGTRHFVGLCEVQYVPR